MSAVCCDPLHSFEPYSNLLLRSDLAPVPLRMKYKGTIGRSSLSLAHQNRSRSNATLIRAGIARNEDIRQS